MEAELTGKISSLESQIETLKKARDHDKTTSHQKIVSITPENCEYIAENNGRSGNYYTCLNFGPIVIIAILNVELCTFCY